MDKGLVARPRRHRRARRLSGALVVTALALVMTLAGLLPKAADAASPTRARPGITVPLDGGTVDAVRRWGVLRCGVGAISEYAWRDETGRMRGFRADLCRAIATVVLNNPDAVEFVQLIASRRFGMLQDGDVDVLVAGVTWTMTREADIGLAFTTPVIFDGQGFLARRSLGVHRLEDLTEPATVCVIASTTTEKNLATFIDTSGLPLTMEPRHTQDGIWSAFLSRSCDLISGDRVSLRLGLAVRARQPEDYVVLPEMISREPLTPVVRHGDPRWEAIVRFTIHALLLAEQKGVTQAMAASSDPDPRDPEARRLLGLDSGAGKALGLDDTWARRAIAAVGHYGEIFERTLGSGSRYGLERGLNALWTDGGLHYPLPLW